MRKQRCEGKICRAITGLSQIEFVYLRTRELFKDSCWNRANDTACRVTHRSVLWCKTGSSLSAEAFRIYCAWFRLATFAYFSVLHHLNLTSIVPLPYSLIISLLISPLSWIKFFFLLYTHFYSKYLEFALYPQLL